MAQQRYVITGFVIDEDTYDFKDTTTGNATTTESGFMSAADKLSLDDVIQAISNMYTKADTDAAIAQSTAPVEFTLTSADSNKFAVIDSACYKIGNVAVVNLSFNVLTSPASTETMFTGFPTPKKSVTVSCGKSGSVAVITGNKLRNNWDSFNANTRYYLNIAYATA